MTTPEPSRHERQKDAEIAEKVMGWRLVETPLEIGEAFLNRDDTVYWRTVSGRLGHGDTYDWSPSTDDAAALTVAEYIRSRGFFVRIGLGRYVACEIHSIDRAGDIWHAVEDTVAAAICEAALAWASAQRREGE